LQYPKASNIRFIQTVVIKHTDLADSILENIAALVLVCDASGNIVYCSPSILHLLQTEETRVLGMGWWELTRPDPAQRKQEIETVKQILKRAGPLDKTPYINTITDPSGKQYWIQWQDSLGPDDTLIGVGQDITEAHHAQQIIREQSIQLKRLSLVAEKTDNIILILDAKGNVEWVSRSFERLNNVSLTDLIARTGPNITDISNYPDMRSILDKVIHEKVSCTYESRNKNVNDQDVWELSTISPVLNEQGEIVNIIIIDSDISDRKILEAELEEKTKDISDSINYAKRIQLALHPDKKILSSVLADSFILFRPKDVVSGDFYSLFNKDGKIIVAAADCTGHGIPGAFMSILATNMLHQIVTENNITRPSEILFLLNKAINEILKQNQNENTDGLDIALCTIDKARLRLEYAGANRPFWLIRNEELKEFSPDKSAVGGDQRFESRTYSNRSMDIKPGDVCYIFSDGYADQFGGNKGKKLMTKTFKTLLLSIYDLPMQEQKKELLSFFKNWSGTNKQTDDVLVIGFKI
jgi:PAS domain S-box-containing protein